MIAYQPTGNPPPAKKLLHRRQQQLHPKSSTSSWHSVSSSSNRNSRLWMVEEAGYENPQKEMDFPSAKLADKLSRSNLRIDPYAKADLHDRYLSSEEEASPSPEDGSSHHSDEDNNNDALDDDEEEEEDEDEEPLSHKKSRTFSIRTSESDKENSIIDLFAGLKDSHPSLAIAVPILAVGRPKLVDITNIAPMHKRKRSSTDTCKPLHTAHRSSHTHTHSLARYPTPENAALDSFPASHPHSHPLDSNTHASRRTSSSSAASSSSAPKRHTSARLLQPESWLPASPTDLPASDDAPTDHYFPDLELRPTPSYNDYDPYSLDPPRLVVAGKDRYSRHSRGGSAGAGVGLMGWRDVARGLSLTRRINGGGLVGGGGGKMGKVRVDGACEGREGMGTGMGTGMGRERGTVGS